MTEALAISNPYRTLKEVITRRNDAKKALEEAEITYNALRDEAMTIAKNIVLNGFVDEVYEFVPTFQQKRRVTKINNDVIKTRFPEIFERAHPHIDGNGAWEVLKSKHEQEELQNMLQELNPDVYRKRATVTKKDLEEVCTSQELDEITAAGGMETDIKFTEDPELIRKDFHMVLAAAHSKQTRPMDEGDD